jgi:hypothetical protein
MASAAAGALSKTYAGHKKLLRFVPSQMVYNGPDCWSSAHTALRALRSAAERAAVGLTSLMSIKPEAARSPR